MNSLLQINKLSCGYNGNVVLQDISFSVAEGESLIIIGQNGCGKSTLMKTIARMIPSQEGTVIFDGHDLNNKNTWDLQRFGLSVFVQGGMIFPTLKVEEHFGLVLKGKNKAEANKTKEQCWSYFPELKKLMSVRGGNLSGGQRQRLSFAILIAQQTKCWLMDEPTAGLSPAAVEEAVQFLKTMKAAGQTMVIVEHNYAAAFEVADEVAVIKEGKLVNRFAPEQFTTTDFLRTHLYN